MLQPLCGRGRFKGLPVCFRAVCIGHDHWVFGNKKEIEEYKKYTQTRGYMEKVAINWNQKGIKTPKQAKTEIYRHDSDIVTIMRALGMENSPTEKEGTFISKWLGELGFTMEIILEACDRTVMAVQKNRLKYCDGILRSWHESKVVTREDIARLDASFTADLGKKKGRNRTVGN